MSKELPEWAVHRAAQIWCEDLHGHKVMDIDFAYSIARALEAAYRKGLEDAAKELERLNDPEAAEFVRALAAEGESRDS